ncbi:MAG TPA: MFS transporter [Burkholderiales bacterium]|nr:MFS transporter [Burkholderiales bacterium]
MANEIDAPARLVARLERLPFSPWHRAFLLVAFFGTLFDAADFALFGAALPAIAKEFHLGPQQAGLLATVGLMGAFLGALFWGTISDYIGRRTAFQATIGIFAVFTGLIAASWNIASLAVFRFLANFGLGGEVPVASTLSSEFMPSKIRGRATGTMMAAFPAGLVLAAGLALAILPNYGWRTLFAVGVVPAIVLFFVRRNVPESVRYLLSKGKVAEAGKAVDEIERRALGAGGGAPAAQIDDELRAAREVRATSRVTVLELIREGRAPRTILLWAVSFCFLWSSNGILFMLPTILTQRGMPLSQAITLTLVQAIGGVFGYVACAFLIDRYGRRPVLFLYFFVGAAFHLAFAVSSGLWMYAAIALVGWVNPGVYGPSTVYAAELYPTHLRATAVGWYFGIGRIGSFLAPAVVGFMLVHGLGQYVLHTFALTYFIAAIAIWLVGIETKGLVLEKITGLDVGAGSPAG